MQDKGIIQFIVLIVISLFSILVLYASKKSLPITPKNDSYIGAEVNSQSMISYVPNFENLSLADLPTLTDVRYVGDYKTHKIIIGYNKVIEYDPVTKTVVRQGSGVLNNIFSGTVIKNMLYTSVNGDMQGTQPNITFGPSSIYVTNLDSGITLKSIRADQMFGDKLLNLYLYSDGDTLYGKYGDGVIKINPEYFEFTKYSSSDLQADTPEMDHIKKVVDVKVSQDGFPEIDRINVISQLSGSQYFLFSNDSVYSLNKNEFPKFLTKIKLAPNIREMDYIDKAYVSADKKWGVLFDIVGGPRGNNPLLNVYKVNLVTGYTVRLKTNESEVLYQNREGGSDTIAKISNLVNEVEFEEADETITVLNSKNDQEILKVYLNEEFVQISK